MLSQRLVPFLFVATLFSPTSWSATPENVKQFMDTFVHEEPLKDEKAQQEVVQAMLTELGDKDLDEALEKALGSRSGTYSASKLAILRQAFVAARERRYGVQGLLALANDRNQPGYHEAGRIIEEKLTDGRDCDELRSLIAPAKFQLLNGILSRTSLRGTTTGRVAAIVYHLGSPAEMLPRLETEYKIGTYDEVDHRAGRLAYVREWETLKGDEGLVFLATSLSDSPSESGNVPLEATLRIHKRIAEGKVEFFRGLGAHAKISLIGAFFKYTNRARGGELSSERQPPPKGYWDGAENDVIKNSLAAILTPMERNLYLAAYTGRDSDASWMARTLILEGVRQELQKACATPIVEEAATDETRP